MYLKVKISQIAQNIWGVQQFHGPLTISEEKGTNVQSMPIPEMNGQKVLVTGAGAGIGRGLTKSLLEMGAEVGILNNVTRNSNSDSILLLELPCSFICSLITIFTPSCAPAHPYIVWANSLDVWVTRPKRPEAQGTRGPRGLQLEVRARRAPRLLIFEIFYNVLDKIFAL